MKAEMLDHLIRRARQQDQGAWEALVEHYRATIYRLALRYTNNAQEAQDLTQDVFLQCYLQLLSLREAAKFPAWLRQMTVNCCHAWHRRRKVHWVALEDREAGVIAYEYTLAHPGSQPFIAYPEAMLERLEAQETVRQALHCLPDKLRHTTSLYYLAGLSCQEVAERLNVPLGTVKRRLYEARQKIKRGVLTMTQEQVVLKQAVGLETTGQRHTAIFGKGMHLPVACTLDFSTATDNQAEITLHLLQGDSQNAAECRQIARLQIGGIAPNQKQREPKIKVTLEIDASGALHYRAKALPDRALVVRGKPAPVEIAFETL